MPLIYSWRSVSQFPSQYIVLVAQPASAGLAEDQSGQQVPAISPGRHSAVLQMSGAAFCRLKATLIHFFTDNLQAFKRLRKLITEVEHSFVDRVVDDP